MRKGAKFNRIDWNYWSALLGTMSDKSLANLIGCDASAVWYKRNRLEIPRYKEPKPENIEIECMCGCEQKLLKYDSRGRKREFLPSHWSNIQPNTRETVCCDNCGAVIVRAKWHIDQSEFNFCNSVCLGKWRTRMGAVRGENNGMWAGGIGTFYPPEFNEKLRETVRDRDDRQCKMCQIKEDSLCRKLDVHHIDYNRDNNNPDNLIALCHSCHAKTSAPIGRVEWSEYFKRW